MKRGAGMGMLAALGLLAACGREEGPGGISAEEQRRLENAAKMLDDNMIDVSPDSLVANEAEIEAIEANEGALAESPPGDTQ
jgi:hypothetical protein